MIKFSLCVDKAADLLELFELLKSDIFVREIRPVPVMCTGVTGPPIFYMPDGATTYYVTFMQVQIGATSAVIPYATLSPPAGTTPVPYGSGETIVFFETLGVPPPCPNPDLNPSTDFFYETATITDPNSGQDVRHRVGDGQLLSAPNGANSVFESQLNPAIFYIVTLQNGASAPGLAFPVFYRYRQITASSVPGPVDLYLQQPF
jgi:hypothetical protein